MLVHSLCSSYHWAFKDALKLTVPQVIMLNHAAWVEHENGDIRWKHKKAQEEANELEMENDPVLDGFGGMRLSEIQEDDTKLNAYLSDWKDFG